MMSSTLQDILGMECWHSRSTGLTPHAAVSHGSDGSSPVSDPGAEDLPVSLEWPSSEKQSRNRGRFPLDRTHCGLF